MLCLPWTSLPLGLSRLLHKGSWENVNVTDKCQYPFSHTHALQDEKNPGSSGLLPKMLFRAPQQTLHSPNYCQILHADYLVRSPMINKGFQNIHIQLLWHMLPTSTQDSYTIQNDPGLHSLLVGSTAWSSACFWPKQNQLHPKQFRRHGSVFMNPGHFSMSSPHADTTFWSLKVFSGMNNQCWCQSTVLGKLKHSFCEYQPSHASTEAARQFQSVPGKRQESAKPIKANIARMTHDFIVHPVLHILVGLTATIFEAAP